MTNTYFKNVKSGLKTCLERFKILKFSFPGEGDTPSPGPYPPHPRPFGPRVRKAALRAANGPSGRGFWQRRKRLEIYTTSGASILLRYDAFVPF